MAKILDILNEFARRVSDPVVQSISDNDDTSNQLLGYIMAACGQIKDEYDWKAMRREYSVTTIAEISEYPYPDDYDRILTWAIFIPELTSWIRAESADESFKRRISGTSGDTDNRYRELADGFKFTYPFTAGLTLRYEYKSKNFIKSKDDVGNVFFIDDFKRDDDEVVFDKELVILAARAVRATELELNSRDALVQQYLDCLEKQKNKQFSKTHLNAFQRPLDNRTLSVARVMATGGGSY